MSGIVIIGELHAVTALHVGHGKESGLTDALFRRDASGCLFIPGTSIAGALRGLLTRLAPRFGSAVCQAFEGENGRSCACDVCSLMGDIQPENSEQSSSRASRLLVRSAKFLGDQGQSGVRDGVGIDRASGVAARAGRVKFDREVLPPGSRFSFRMELRGSAEELEGLKCRLAMALHEWRAGRAWLGGGASRGLGRFVLDPLEVRELFLDDAARLMQFLRSDTAWEACPPKDAASWIAENLPGRETLIPFEAIAVQRNTEAGSAAPAGEATAPAREASGGGAPARAMRRILRNWVEFSATLRANGPFLTNDSASAGLCGFDHAPLLALAGDWEHPVLPGSSIRGVLRSQAEKIARTLAGFRAVTEIEAENRPADASLSARPPRPSPVASRFARICPACNPVENRTNAPLPACSARIARSKDLTREQRLKFQKEGIDERYLCLGCRLFGSTWEGSRLFVADAPFVPAKDTKGPAYKMMDFLALDRFTGGGLDGAKFDALALWRPRFAMRLYLENPEPWELGWLALALRDLATGWVPIGFGAAKGFGRVRFETSRVAFGYLSGADDLKVSTFGCVEHDGLFNVVTASQADWLGFGPLVSEWIEAFHSALGGFGLPSEYEEEGGGRDSYFTSNIPHYYPMEVTLP